MKRLNSKKMMKALGTTVGMVGTLMMSASIYAQTITIGYQGMMNPWKHIIAEKQLEAAGLDVKWVRFDSGAKVITAMASGSVDIASAGSSPIAAAISNGVDIELIWILENINEAEALVVKNSSNISAPQDLKGKTIGVPFVSTTHFHTLFALEQFGLSESDVKVLNMQPNAIAAAWTRGDIDAAFIWDPVLSQIKEDGSVLITSGTLGEWGKATFDGVVVNTSFGEENPEAVAKVLSIMAKADEEYRSSADSLTVDSPMVKNIASVTGGSVDIVLPVLALYDFPTISEQLSCAWLGCEGSGGAAKALMFTSEFLAEQGRVPGVKDDYSVYVNPSFAEAAGAM